MNNDCDCFEHRIKCTNCHRDVDITEYENRKYWRKPEQLELDLPERPQLPELDSDGFFNFRDIPAV